MLEETGPEFLQDRNPIIVRVQAPPPSLSASCPRLPATSVMVPLVFVEGAEAIYEYILSSANFQVCLAGTVPCALCKGPRRPGIHASYEAARMAQMAEQSGKTFRVLASAVASPLTTPSTTGCLLTQCTCH